FRFMKDAPFGLDNHGNSTVGASVNLYNALLQQFGVNNGADISIIYPENNNTMKNYKYMDLSGSSSRIKIGGYITKGSKYKEIGYMDNGKFKKIDDIKTGNFTYKHRISFNDNISKNDLTKIGVGSETQFYITKHYNNGSSFVNKELYLSDGVHQFKLKTTRSGSFVGKTSSYRPYFPSRLGRTYYEAVVSNSKLMIKEQTWT
ncbi:MAG: hypothetical protein KAG91_01680, partial [Mycoplasmataceae bacterium]|nr:hypothetical protein [Mycoplasmataceae bacterium]